MKSPRLGACNSNIRAEDARPMKPRQGGSLQKLRKACGVRRGDQRDAAAGRRENGFGIGGIADLIAEDQLSPHASHGDLDAETAWVSHQNIQIEGFSL